MQKDRIVCTYYVKPNGGIITHAYGPHTVSRAQAVRREIQREHPNEVTSGALHVSVNRMIDLDG